MNSVHGDRATEHVILAGVVTVCVDDELVLQAYRLTAGVYSHRTFLKKKGEDTQTDARPLMTG